MKKIFMLVVVFMVLSINIYGQSTVINGRVMNQEEIQREYERELNKIGGMSPLWGRTNLPWLDGALLRCLQYFDGIYIFSIFK